MPDIMMCGADACPKSSTCYRHEDSGTRPDKYAQTFWLREPQSPTGDDCPHFWSTVARSPKAEADHG